MQKTIFQIIQQHLDEGKKTVPRMLVSKLLVKTQQYQEHQSDYLDLIVDLSVRIEGLQKENEELKESLIKKSK